AITHLECTNCNKVHDHNQAHTTCTNCEKVLYPRYDFEKAKETLTKISMHKRTQNIWRMMEIMPCTEPYQFTLGEGGTALLELKERSGIQIFAKDEGSNPTGSFKARGLCSAVSKACEIGISEFVIPTAGNAGAALAAYCSRTKTIANIFFPKDTPDMIQLEMAAFGANTNIVDGLITDAGKIAKEEAKKHGWFDVSTLKEPYRVEGKKTMGLEIAEQLDWKLPDVIIYPTGGGTGIVGMAKAFDELEQLGLIGNETPRMVSVQSDGCAPIVRAFNKKKDFAEPWENAKTIAPGLRVPAAIGDYLILKAIYESNGTAIAVSDNEIIESMKEAARKEGLFLSPEAAATYSAVDSLITSGWIDKGENVVIFTTATGFTTPNQWRDALN
ncbi:MAG: threonine synthase, partial [Candidatus Kariarchaeaceae archaeon]